jgi:hypothetical protein
VEVVIVAEVFIINWACIVTFVESEVATDEVFQNIFDIPEAEIPDLFINAAFIFFGNCKAYKFLKKSFYDCFAVIAEFIFIA